MSWTSRPVHGFLLDIHGVIYDSGENGPVPIPGSIDAFNKLKSLKVPVRLVSNESSIGKPAVVQKCLSLGLNVDSAEIFTPPPAAAAFVKESGLRPLLIVHRNVVKEFDDINQKDPNCVLIGDACENFDYRSLNSAFKLLINDPKSRLLSMGQGKFYKNTDGYNLDVGPFMKALEYSSGKKAEVIGKPSPLFFSGALKSMNLSPESVVMIGDDINNDVGGAQSIGMRGLMVRTGKYLPADENHPEVKPDAFVDNLAAAVEAFVSSIK